MLKDGNESTFMSESIPVAVKEPEQVRIGIRSIKEGADVYFDATDVVLMLYKM